MLVHGLLCPDTWAEMVDVVLAFCMAMAFGCN